MRNSTAHCCTDVEEEDVNMHAFFMSLIITLIKIIMNLQSTLLFLQKIFRYNPIRIP